MIKNILLYVIVVLATGFSFFIYEGAFVGILLAVELVYFLMAIVQVVIIKHTVNMEIDSIIPIVEKGSVVKLGITVKSNRKWSLGRYKAEITIANVLERKKIIKKVRGATINGARETFDFIPTRCGSYEVRINKFYITDMLGFIKTRKKLNQYMDIGVVPEANLIPIEVSRKTRDFLADADDYSTREGGDDPSELYQIREYREGDSLHDIHWKLSAKEEELMVKERGKPLGAPVLIKLDLNYKKRDSGKIKNLSTLKKGFRGTAKEDEKTVGNDDILIIMAAIAFSIFDAECICMVAWYDASVKKVEKMRVHSEEDFYYLLNHALYMKPYMSDEYVDTAFEEAFRGMEFNTIIELDSKGTVKVNKEIIDVPKNKQKGRMRNSIAWERFVISV